MADGAGRASAWPLPWLGVAAATRTGDTIHPRQPCGTTHAWPFCGPAQGQAGPAARRGAPPLYCAGPAQGRLRTPENRDAQPRHPRRRGYLAQHAGHRPEPEPARAGQAGRTRPDALGQARPAWPDRLFRHCIFAMSTDDRPQRLHSKRQLTHHRHHPTGRHSHRRGGHRGVEDI